MYYGIVQVVNLERNSDLTRPKPRKDKPKKFFHISKRGVTNLLRAGRKYIYPFQEQLSFL